MPDNNTKKQNTLDNGVHAILKLISRFRLPRMSGERRVYGLDSPVDIIRDQWGVPHIYANNFYDLFFSQGFVQAQDRLWQMEFNRRLVAGRLSEVLGSLTEPVDRWLRTLTMRRVAEFEVKLLSDEARTYLQAFADGVNAFIKGERLPIEFTLLRYKPEPWVIADTLSWIKMMSWSLSVNWEAEILRSKLVDRLGPELAAQLEPPHLQRWPYIIPPGTEFGYIGTDALEKARSARPFAGPSPYQGLGSNNWALSGSMTSSGKPILANDMHLLLSIPAIWYENHLITKDLEMTGVTFPGIPGIVSGHNGHVAWSFTNGFPDVQDLYMERLRRSDDGSVQVEYKGDWEDAQVLQETIFIKNEEPVVEEVIITRHGPIINNLAEDFCGDQPLALRWTSLEPDTMIDGIFAMVNSKDCQEFRQALRHWTAPVQNVVYADTKGNIAYSFPGKVPVRSKGRGLVPVPGWTDEYEWIGYIDFDDLPHMMNPPQGYIVTANNCAVCPDYPLRLDLEHISGDRAQRISEMILDPEFHQGEEKIDIPFIQRMQFDQHSPSARVIARHIGAINFDKSQSDPELTSIIKLMKSWDGELSPESTQAAIYEVFIREMVSLLLARRLDSDMVIRYMGKGPIPLITELSLFGDRWLPWLTHILSDPESNWFNLGGGEKRDEVIRLALRNTIHKLNDLLGPEIKKWKWGALHQLTYAHPLAASKLLERLFNRGPYPIGGDGTTIWATGSNYHTVESGNVVGPPYRMIIDLGDINNSVSLLSPGQSGNPASRHYDDQVEAWHNGEYHPMLFSRAGVEQAATQIMRLLPK